MTVYYKRATSTSTDVLIATGAWYTNSGVAATTATLAARLSDQTDSTFVYRNNFASAGRLYFRLESALRATLAGATGASIPATEAVRSITPVIRTQSNSVGDVTQPSSNLFLGYTINATGCSVVAYNTPTPINGATFVAANRSGAATTTRYAGGDAWTIADLNSPTATGLVIRLDDNAVGSVSHAPRFLDVWAEITTTTIPTVTVDAPADPFTDSLTPTVTWTFTDGDLEAQTFYEVKVFSAAQYGATGFSADTSTPTATSSVTAGNFGSWTVTSPLANNITYRAYVRAGKDNAGTTLWSAWAFKQFTLSVVAPFAPLISQTWDATNQRAVLTVGPQPRNLLTAADANLEASIGSWGDFVNNAVTYPQRVNTVAKEGSWSIAQRANGAGPVTIAAAAYTLNTVTGGVTYAASMWVRSAVNARDAQIKVVWYTSASVYISEMDSTAVTGSTSTWVPVRGVFVAPANAAYARVVSVFQATTNAAGEIHYTDRLSLTAAPQEAATVRTNLVTNPSFEVGTTDWTAQGTGASIARVTTDSYVGGACLEVTNGAGIETGAQFAPAYPYLPLIGGKPYTFSVWVKVPAGQPSAGLQAWCRTYDSTLTLVADFNSTTTTVTSVMGWTRLSFSFTAGATVAYALFRVWRPSAGTAGAKFLVDAALLEPTSVLENGDFEVDAYGWTQFNSASTQRITASPYAGSGALQITTPTNSNPGAQTAKIGVNPALTYTLSGYMKNISGTTRSIHLQVAWHDATDTFISYSGLVTASSLAAGSAWTFASNSSLAPPATARYARVLAYAHIGAATAGWQSGFDAVTFGPNNQPRSYFDGSTDNGEMPFWTGTANASTSQTWLGWNAGGYTYSSLSITRADSQGTRTPRLLPAGSTSVVSANTMTAYSAATVFYDYEAARGEAVTYRATGSLVNAGVIIPSSTVAYPSLTTTNDGTNWLKPIYAPTLSDGGLLLKTGASFDLVEEQGVFKPRGRGYQIVVSGGLYGTSGSFEITTPNAADWALLEAIVEHKGVLLWQDPYGGHRWIRLTKRAYTQTGPTSRPVRVITCDYVEVGPD